jgi:hypothetical protein
MHGKTANRTPEPVAVPIHGDMRTYLEMQPRTRKYLFARGSVPIKDFMMSWSLAYQASGCQAYYLTISVGLLFGISGVQGWRSR